MRNRVFLLASIVSLSLFGMTACSGDDSNAEKPGTPEPQAVTVKTAESELGKILVDQSGRTLYGFTVDKDGESNCAANCIAVWPALTSPSDAKSAKDIDKSLLTRTERAEGALQVKYKDWPLYYYVGDVVPGDLNGQGIDDEWFAVAPDGSLVK
ncbi:hypothetical protein ACIOKD_27475 [Streptomyces sp. NPDC087844]|uniref:COG4315 family predicted lipoprotein n=1 Tax=Streptomyces sp. NPDC087844 TaxID=3365805 RepID=UPI003803A897